MGWGEKIDEERERAGTTSLCTVNRNEVNVLRGVRVMHQCVTRFQGILPISVFCCI